jgi:hypothetical protein
MRVVFRKLALVAALSSSSSYCVGILTAAVALSTEVVNADTLQNTDEMVDHRKEKSSSNSHLPRSLQTQTTTMSYFFLDEENAKPLFSDIKKKVDLRPNNMADTTTSSGVRTAKKTISSTSSMISNTLKKRYVVKCAAGISIAKCEEDILNTSGESVTIVNPMPNTDMFAVEMYEPQSQEMSLKTHVDHIEDDPPRFLLKNLRSSSSNPDGGGRTLIQNEGYGIDNVNAQAVWDGYRDIVGESAAKGGRTKVCVIDTGLRSTHDDLDEARLSGSQLGGFNWVRLLLVYFFLVGCVGDMCGRFGVVHRL